jgi:hypothetical protein
VKLIFDAHRLDNEQARYLIEAVFKAGEQTRQALLSSAPDDLPDAVDAGIAWEDLDFILYRTENVEVLAQWIVDVCEADDLASRICCCEVDYDLFLRSYEDLLALMAGGWGQDGDNESVEAILRRILQYADKNDVPRVKLRLLLEFAGYLEGLGTEDDNSTPKFESLLKATRQIDETLHRLPEAATERTNGQWFYARRLQALREFWAEQCNMPISLGRSASSSIQFLNVRSKDYVEEPDLK